MTQPRPIVADHKAINALIGDLLKATQLSVPEAAKRLGCSPNAAYARRRGRQRIPVSWFLALAQLAGAQVKVKFS